MSLTNDDIFIFECFLLDLHKNKNLYAHHCHQLKTTFNSCCIRLTKYEGVPKSNRKCVVVSEAFAVHGSSSREMKSKMADPLKQHASIKFCFLLGKNAVESVVILNTAYNEDAMEKPASGLPVSKKGKCRLKINMAPDVLQFIKPSKMSENFRTDS